MSSAASPLDKSSGFSTKIINSIRKELEKISEYEGSENICILTTGSYARKEASSESDLDAFIITSTTEFDKEICLTAESIIKKIIPKDTGSTNTFSLKHDGVETIEQMVKDLGGDKDKNEKLTRRMLLILESNWLFNEGNFKKYKRDLVEQYFKDGVNDQKLSRFFLNDLIRYYRTITTDYEYKTRESGQSWGVRNVKLRFSRKLIYFSGLIIAAETFGKEREKRISMTLELMDMSPIERIQAHAKKKTEIIGQYESFLEKISDKKIRNELNKLDEKDKDSNKTFQDFRKEASEFSKLLEASLKETYKNDHPIHHALLF